MTMTMTMSNDITVRFPLTKGEGEFPELSQFSEQELSDLRTCLSLSICWDPDAMEESSDSKIVSIEILYDGVTHVEGNDYGYWIEDDEDFLCGYPAPIIRFKLDRPLDVEQFRIGIFTSSYNILTSSMEENDAEPYFAEDHNGYTSVIPEDEVDDIIDELKEEDVFCGKVFLFPDGLPEGGYQIKGTEFVLHAH